MSQPKIMDVSEAVRLMEEQKLLKACKRRHKYNAKATVVDGYKFASKKEAECYVKLAALEKAGAISDLTLQPRFSITVNGVHICNYVGDFQWYEDGKQVIADAKGCRLREYILKKKLMLACHGVSIMEL